MLYILHLDADSMVTQTASVPTTLTTVTAHTLMVMETEPTTIDSRTITSNPFTTALSSQIPSSTMATTESSTPTTADLKSTKGT